MYSINIITERLIIKNIELENVNLNYFNWLKSEENTKYIINSSSIKTIDDLKKYVCLMINKPDVIFLAIFDKNSNIHIGNIKFEPINISEKYTILGILIGDNAYKGIGIAQEVIINIASFLNSNYGINKILLGVNKHNLPAIKAYEKIGFEITTSNFISKKSNDSIIYELNLFNKYV
jgi:ribosomal-protein-alanine N-acetyltransferase